MVLLSSPNDTAGLLALASFVFLLFSLHFERKRRLLDDTPVSKALGVFIGEVELEGVSHLEKPLTGYLSRLPCIMYEWSISEHWEREEEEEYVDDKGRRKTRMVTRYGWDVIASGGKRSGFYLRDETGYVWVNPEGAKIEMNSLFNEEFTRGDKFYYARGLPDAVEGSTGERSFHEEGIAVGTQLFVRGRASERPDIVAAQIKQEDKTEIFIITPRTEKELSAGGGAAFVSCGVLGGFCAFATGAGAGFVEGTSASQAFRYFCLFFPVVFYLGVFAVGWTWMVFNSLVGVRQRVYQAYSLVDVQLKRRAELIPRLAACLEGYRQHEATLLEAIARLRAQAGSGHVEAMTPMLLAVSERYPELKAMESFSSLIAHLIETEQRIMLARNYYNSCVTFYNTRLQRIPDRYVAGIVKMQPAELFQAAGFERVAPALKF